MKKIFMLICLLLTFVCVVQAGAPAITATNPPYTWEYQTGSATRTSITGADSATLASKITLPQGFYFLLTVTDSIAAAADSIQYYVECYNAAGTAVVARAYIGASLTGSSGRGQWVIPYGQTIIGGKVNIKAVKSSAAVVAKVKTWEITRGRPITTNKNWTIEN